MAHAQVVMHLKVVVWNGSGRSDALITLSYATTDPYAVELCASEESTPWRFDRELLVGGMTGVCGTGDVRIEPDDDGVVFRLDNGRRAALVLAPREPIMEFLHNVYGLVPNGHERVVVPDTVEELLYGFGDDHGRA